MHLMDLFEFSESPLYLLDKVLTILREEEICQGGLTLGHCTSRDTFINRMVKRYGTDTPEAVRVPIIDHQAQGISTAVSNRDFVFVVRSNFETQFLDLIQDHTLFGDLNNLKGCINPDYLFEPYLPKDGTLNEVHDGLWYRETIKEVQTLAAGEPFFVFPIIFYIDKTGTDVNQRNSVEPFLFSTTVLNRLARGNPRAWKVLGFVPDLDLSSSAYKTRARGSKWKKASE